MLPACYQPLIIFGELKVCIQKGILVLFSLEFYCQSASTIHQKVPLTFKIYHLTEARQCFWYHSRTAGPIWPNFSRFPQLVLFGGFPAGNKGVFRTTGDRGRNFLGDYGYRMGTLKSKTHFKIGDSSL